MREDAFTSIHIEEFEIEARDTKLGPEEITRDIPNVSESALKDLDECGIVRIGATVKAGRHPGGQGHAQGRDPAHPRGEAAARHLRREGGRRPRRLASRRRRASRGRSSTSRSSPARASRRTCGPRRSRQYEIARIEKNIKDEVRILTEERNKKITRPAARQEGDGGVKPAHRATSLLKKGDEVTQRGPRATRPARRSCACRSTRTTPDRRRSRSSTGGPTRTSRSCTGSTRSGSSCCRRATSCRPA